MRHPRVIADHAELSDFFLGRHGVIPEWLPYALLDTETRPLLWNPYGPRNTLDYPILEFEMARLRTRSIADYMRRLNARATLARQAEIRSPVIRWKPEELVLSTEINDGEESSMTRHWKSLAKGIPGFDDRLGRLREWYWARCAEAVRTPRDRWGLAERLAEAGRCDQAEAEFLRATTAEPALAKPDGDLAECRARHRGA